MVPVTSPRFLLVTAIVMNTVQTSVSYPTPPSPTTKVRTCPAVCEQLQHENGTTTGNAENMSSTNTTLNMHFARVTLEGPDFEYQFFDMALSLVSPNARALLRKLENVTEGKDIVWENALEGTKLIQVGPPRMHALFEVIHLLKVYVNQSRDINLTTDLYTLWWLTDAVFRETYDQLQKTRNGQIQAMAFSWAQSREVIGDMLNTHCNVVCHRQYVIDKFNIPYDYL
ncbi:uncharacterized protein [Haliotis asinina]|uniref:uncharacterized protein n=1 Tax=Haliotis asinina TaxID=109174 RepID=UPI003531A2CF